MIIAVEKVDTDFEEWMWDSITTVLQMKDKYRPELMCYTHGKGRKYGFFQDMPVYYQTNSSELSRFIDILKSTIKMQNADVMALDLLDLLGSCNNTEQHTEQIISVVTKVINETKTVYKDLKVREFVIPGPRCSKHP